MLVTDVGVEVCWRQLKDFGDGFCHLVAIIYVRVDTRASLFSRRLLSFYVSILRQHSKDRNLKSPTLRSHQHHCHQHDDTTMMIQPT